MYDEQAIRAEINEKRAEAKALAELIKAEEREPTEDEQSTFDALVAEIGEDGDTPTGLQAKLQRAKKYSALLNQHRNESSDTHIPAVHTQSGGEPFALPRGAVRRAQGLKFYGRNSSDHPVHDAYAVGRWLCAINGDVASTQWCEDNGIGVYAAMTEGDNSRGGFFVPDEMSSRIIDLRYMYGYARRYADIEPMGSDTKTISRRKSGVTAYAVGEGDAFAESDLQFNQVKLVADKYGVLVKMSDELDEDSLISMADRVTGEAAWAFAKKEDEALFVGDGTSSYHGVMGVVNKADDGNHAGAIYTAASGNTAFATLDLADFEGMVGQLPSWADEGAAWYVHKQGWAASIMRLQMAAGGNTTVDLGNGPQLQFLGYPVRFVPVLNSTTAAQVNTAGLCVLANLPLCSTLGDRNSALNVKVLNELYAANGQIGLRFHERVAINNHSITDPEDGTGATAGAAVVLKTPGS